MHMSRRKHDLFHYVFCFVCLFIDVMNVRHWYSPLVWSMMMAWNRQYGGFVHYDKGNCVLFVILYTLLKAWRRFPYISPITPPPSTCDFSISLPLCWVSFSSFPGLVYMTVAPCVFSLGAIVQHNNNNTKDFQLVSGLHLLTLCSVRKHSHLSCCILGLSNPSKCQYHNQEKYCNIPFFSIEK